MQSEKLFATSVDHGMLRKVREIVTVSGQIPRGHFPSRKAKRLKYESLIELDSLRVFEVASHVTKVLTQQLVIKIASDGRTRRYTPDFTAKILDKDFYVEVKPDDFAANPKVANRMKDVVAFMRKENLNFFFITADDVRANGLQDILKDLLAKRPPPGRYELNRDPNIWDTPGSELTEPELTAQWIQAQKFCNDLLERVMKRDPDSLFPTA